MEKFQSEIKFDANGLVPAIVQDADTNEVLMMAYINAESLSLTFETVRFISGHAAAASCGTRAQYRETCRAWLKCALIAMGIRFCCVCIPRGQSAIRVSRRVFIEFWRIMHYEPSMAVRRNRRPQK